MSVLKHQHIVLDFEMNPTRKEKRRELPREIIEIGAVKLDADLHPIDSFHTYVKPAFGTILLPITHLTGISDRTLSDAVSFEKALAAFAVWLGSDETEICSWSNADRDQLLLECAKKCCSVPHHEVWTNLQDLYAQAMGYGRCQPIALHRAAGEIGLLMDVGRSHSALYDAEITSELLRFVRNGECEKQAGILKKAKQTPAKTGVSLGESCGDIFRQILCELAENERLGIA